MIVSWNSQMKYRRMKRALAQLTYAGIVLFLLTGCAKKRGVEEYWTGQQTASPNEIQLQSRTFTPKPGVPRDLGDRIKFAEDSEEICLIQVSI